MTEAGEVVGEDGERVAERLLRGIAVTASVLLSQEKGDAGVVVEEMDGLLHAPHMNGDRIHANVGRWHLFKGPRCSKGSLGKGCGRRYRREEI